MQSVLYIDVLFCVNWMMNTAMLVLTGRFLKRRLHPAAIAVAAACGAIWVCLCAALGIPGAMEKAGGLGPVAFGMVFIAYRTHRIRALVRAVMYLYLSAILLGGLIHILYDNTAFGRFWQLWMKGQEAEAVSVWLLTLATAASLFVLEAAIRYREMNQGHEYIQDVTLTYQGRQLTVTALWDSGNQLYDPFSGQAVHILELAACKELLGAETCHTLTALARGETIYRVRTKNDPKEKKERENETDKKTDNVPETPAYLIPCRSLGNAHGLLPVMKLERLHSAAGFCQEAPLIGFCLTTLSKEESYRMLLHSQADKKRRNSDDY